MCVSSVVSGTLAAFACIACPPTETSLVNQKHEQSHNIQPLLYIYLTCIGAGLRSMGLRDRAMVLLALKLNGAFIDLPGAKPPCQCGTKLIN